jgi:hypothetical protein
MQGATKKLTFATYSNKQSVEVKMLQYASMASQSNQLFWHFGVLLNGLFVILAVVDCISSVKSVVMETSALRKATEGAQALVSRTNSELADLNHSFTIQSGAEGLSREVKVLSHNEETITFSLDIAESAEHHISEHTLPKDEFAQLMTTHDRTNARPAVGVNGYL